MPGTQSGSFITSSTVDSVSPHSRPRHSQPQQHSQHQQHSQSQQHFHPQPPHRSPQLALLEPEDQVHPGTDQRQQVQVQVPAQQPHHHSLQLALLERRGLSDLKTGQRQAQIQIQIRILARIVLKILVYLSFKNTSRTSGAFDT